MLDAHLPPCDWGRVADILSYLSFKFVVGCVPSSMLDVFWNFGGADSWRWCGFVWSGRVKFFFKVRSKLLGLSVWNPDFLLFLPISSFFDWLVCSTTSPRFLDLGAFHILLNKFHSHRSSMGCILFFYPWVYSLFAEFRIVSQRFLGLPVVLEFLRMLVQRLRWILPSWLFGSSILL